MSSSDTRPVPLPTRRDFLKTSAAVGAGVALEAQVVRAAFAAGDETIRVGLVGCGGRGSGAAAQALTADRQTKLVAMGDAFADHLEKSHAALKQTPVGDRVDVPSDRRFVGFDAYQQVIDSGVDVVLLATPPHFRPMHLAACIEAGKHVFVEKPVAVDAPGVRSVLETCRKAKQQGLAVVSGLCWRYETGMQEIVGKIHEGALGEIVSLSSTRYGGGAKNPVPRTPGMSGMEYQMRNWYYYTWLSGDFNVEQFVHEMDKMAWVMGNQYPVSCTSTGGRQQRVEPEYGHIYDHFSTIFEYADGTRYYATTRHQRGCSNLNQDLVAGTRGTADLMKYTIDGENAWRSRQRKTDMHQLEHDAMYAALRRGEIINNGDYMARSTMMGIIARMSAYTGKTLAWDQALNSDESLTPPAYDWKLDLPMPPVATPGVTEFV